MSGITLNSVENDKNYEPIAMEDRAEDEQVEQVEQAETGGFRFAIPEFLKAKSPDEPIENFINHPFNFDGSRGLAQMIKGFTGMFGSFNYAVVDIVMGWLRWTRERKENKIVID